MTDDERDVALVRKGVDSDRTRIRKAPLLARALRRPELGALSGVILIYVIFFAMARDSGMFTVEGLVNILQVSAEIGILAVAAALLMIAGEFDLSMGSMIGIAGVIIGLSATVYGLPLSYSVSHPSPLPASKNHLLLSWRSNRPAPARPPRARSKWPPCPYAGRAGCVECHAGNKTRNAGAQPARKQEGRTNSALFHSLQANKKGGQTPPFFCSLDGNPCRCRRGVFGAFHDRLAPGPAPGPGLRLPIGAGPLAALHGDVAIQLGQQQLEFDRLELDPSVSRKTSRFRLCSRRR